MKATYSFASAIPPYDRQTIEEGDTTTQRKGGWVRFGDQSKGGAKQEDQGGRAIFKDFTEPATKAGAEGYSRTSTTTISISGAGRSGGFSSNRNAVELSPSSPRQVIWLARGLSVCAKFMRRTFDDLWIIDLGGDNLGTRKTPNVFNIQTPVAIAIGVRAPKPSSRYARKVCVTPRSKVRPERTSSPSWKRSPVLVGLRGVTVQATGTSRFYLLERVTFRIGPKSKIFFRGRIRARNSSDRGQLVKHMPCFPNRYFSLIAAEPEKRKPLFKESSRPQGNVEPGKQIAWIGFRHDGIFCATPRLIAMPFVPSTANMESWTLALVTTYARSFRKRSERKSSLRRFYQLRWAMERPLQCSSDLPDLHHFRGSFGGKDVIPLYRDAAGNRTECHRRPARRARKSLRRSRLRQRTLRPMFMLSSGASPTRGASGTSLKRLGRACR